ncbi:MAG: peptidase, partial [Myxococcota bacterium]
TQFPPILLSHGTGGSAAQLGWLAETLASRGAIVAAVDHHGNTAVEPAQLPHGFVLWWERPRDLSVLVDLLLDDPRLGPLIDRDRVSAAGFSLGGYSVLALAGAQVSMEQHAIHCASNVDSAACALPPEAGFDPTELERLRQEDPDFKASLQRAGQSYADDRVSRVYAIAPVLGPAITGPSLSSTKTPMAITVGTEDRQAWDSAIAYREHLPAGLEWREIEGLGHYTFLARCTWRGRWFAGPICHDRPGVDRRAVHRDIADHAASFLLH